MHQRCEAQVLLQMLVKHSFLSSKVSHSEQVAMKDTWLATAPRLAALLAAALVAVGVVRAEVDTAVAATVAAAAAIENATAAVDVVTLLGKKLPTPSTHDRVSNTLQRLHIWRRWRRRVRRRIRWWVWPWWWWRRRSDLLCECFTSIWNAFTKTSQSCGGIGHMSRFVSPTTHHLAH